MRFATVCTLAFAICGEANRDKVAAVSKGTTEDLEPSKTSLRSRVWRLAVLALSSAVTSADAFGVRPFQKDSNTAFAPILGNNPLDGTHDMLRPANANRANFAPNLATPQVFPHDIKLYANRQGEEAETGVEASSVIKRKTMDIFLCRHGTSTWNLLGKWQGEQDTELAPAGIKQAGATADLLAERLAMRGQHVRRIFASDLRRARHTAEIYAERFGCELIVEPKLREPSLGKFEGMTREKIYSEHADLFKQLGALPQNERLRTAYFEGLETPLQTSRRVEEVADLVFDSCSSDNWGDAVLFVSHSKVMEAVLASVFCKYYEGVDTDTCAFFHWKYAKDGHELGQMNRIECYDHIVEQ